MKKLLVALGAIALAVSTQAAMLQWSSYGFINDGSADEDWITGGQAYLVMVTDTANFKVGDDLSITGGTVVDSIGIEGGSATGAWDTNELVDGETYNFAVIFTTDGTAGTTMPTSGDYAVDTNGGTGGSFYSVTWATATGGSFVADDSYEGASISTPVGGSTPTPTPTPDIPEPTTYALVGLAAAALALRKRFRK